MMMVMTGGNAKMQENRKEKEVQSVNARRHQGRSRKKGMSGPAAVQKTWTSYQPKSKLFFLLPLPVSK
jgi:hypothetical protein